jgi:predicted Zn-dependent protease
MKWSFDMSIKFKSITLTACLSIVALSGCTTSPTGRSQAILFSEAEMTSLGVQSFEQMKSELTISQDAVINEYVQCVTDAVLKGVPRQDSFSEWEVVVFESNQVNAFALPGGKIGVYTGLLNVANNQHQLATVIGHEIAHVLANHSNERFTHAQIANTSMQITNVMLNDQEYQNEIMGLLGVGVQYGVILPYGRTQESEADVIGLELMAEAGFEPTQSMVLWQNMAKASGGQQPPEILSTHPSHSTRINDLTNKSKSLANISAKTPNCAL